MNRYLQRLLTAGALARERFTRTSPRPAHPRHVLVLHFPVAVGIAMAETSMLEALRQLNPAPRITVAASGSALEILRHSPFVDRLIAVPHPAHNLQAAVRALHSATADVDCVLFGAFDRQRAIGRLARLVTRAWRAGFAEEPHTLQQSLPFDPTISVLGNHLRAAELLGWSGAPPRPKIYFSAAEATQARSWLGHRPAYAAGHKPGQLANVFLGA